MELSKTSIEIIKTNAFAFRSYTKKSPIVYIIIYIFNCFNNVVNDLIESNILFIPK